MRCPNLTYTMSKSGISAAVFFAVLLGSALLVQATPIPDDSESGQPIDTMVTDDPSFEMLLAEQTIDRESRFNIYQDVNIVLYTRKSPNVGQHIQLNSAAQLKASHFVRTHPTRFIIHGWMGDGNASINYDIRQAYFRRGENNVFVVDWGLGANSNYVTSRNRVGDVGRYVAQFIDFLVGTTGVPFSSITVIGHSLGAHVAGFAGKLVTRGRLTTLIGLDPALPLFSIDRPETRLNRNDALYVQTITTDGGRKGFDQPIGAVSFYPAFGRQQPGCGSDRMGTCAHERAVTYFVESVLTAGPSFTGHRCTDFEAIRSRSCTTTGQKAQMGGLNVQRPADGVYFVPLNGQAPFSRG